MLRTIIYIAIAGLLVFIITFSAIRILIDAKYKNEKKKQKKKVQGFIPNLNHNDVVATFGKTFANKKLENIFNRAKNPWGMTYATFQAIRFGGLFICAIVGLVFVFSNWKIALFIFGIGVLCFWYPMYYYKAIGDEREAEWSKMYGYVWVVKHNIMLYDPKKAYMNVKIYIENNAPHNKELITGFNDFFKYWNEDQIDPYIERYYPFNVTRELVQIIFNMHKTGEFPEDSLNSLRTFIINRQDLVVEKQLSGVAGKATIFSLPFLMVSVILALLVPLISQIIAFL